jgi:hypothetical protein
MGWYGLDLAIEMFHLLSLFPSSGDKIPTLFDPMTQLDSNPGLCVSTWYYEILFLSREDR